jgi:hypothetical protein
LALAGATPSDDALGSLDHVRMLNPNKLPQLLVRHRSYSSKRCEDPRILDLA